MQVYTLECELPEVSSLDDDDASNSAAKATGVFRSARFTRLRAKIKMVPSDPWFSLFPDRHARPEHGIQISRASASLLPSAAFGRLRLNA
jgi:hypothetical protein